MARAIDLLDEPAAQSASDNADQLEASAIIDGTVPFERALVDDVVSDSLDDEIPVAGGDPMEDFGESEFKRDSAVSALVAELDRRKRALGPAYPFDIGTGHLTYRRSNTLVYELCLAITQAPNITEKPFCRLPREFERLTAIAVQLWLGPGAYSYRAGWPPDGDRPTTFRRTIEDLHERSREWWWQPRNEMHAEPREVKDGGVDVVVWKHPPDDRTGGIFLLGQCGCGNNWATKLRELSPEIIEKKYVRDISIAGELRFMSTPFHVPHEKTWEDISLDGGITFDRIRLTRIAENRKNRRKIKRLTRHDFAGLIRLVFPDFV